MTDQIVEGGEKFDRALVQQIASAHGLRHTLDCRDANPRGSGGFVCRCDFFDRVRALREERAITDTGAKIVAQRLLDEGFYQTSRKYCGVAKLPAPEPGNLLRTREHSRGEHRELPPEVFSAFRALGGGPYWPERELERLRRLGLCADVDLTFRVPTPAGFDVGAVFSEVGRDWPEATFRGAVAHPAATADYLTFATDYTEFEMRALRELGNVLGARHARECAERGGGACDCRYVERVLNLCAARGEVDRATANAEARRLLDEGYYQTSAKRHLVAQARVVNFLAPEFGESRELSASVWAAFRGYGGGAYTTARELARLQRLGRCASADFTFRVPVPVGTESSVLFATVARRWPHASFLAAVRS